MCVIHLIVIIILIQISMWVDVDHVEVKEEVLIYLFISFISNPQYLKMMICCIVACFHTFFHPCSEIALSISLYVCFAKNVTTAAT